MIRYCRGLGLLAVLILAAVARISLAEDDPNMKPVLDTGEKNMGNYPIKPDPNTDPKEKKKAGKQAASRLAHAVQYHVKNLKDPDPDVRLSSCEMLAVLGSPDAVEPLIAVLLPEQKEQIKVSIAAQGALVKITGQNFGYKDYDSWLNWWHKNKLEFIQKAANGVDETAKISAVAANTVGLELLRHGDYRAAYQQFLNAADKDPTIPDYKNNLGLSLLEMGRYFDAMEYFNETIGADRDLPQPYMNIGRCYSRMERTIEAQNWYKQALERDKDGRMWDLPWMIGKEYMRRTEWPMAKEYLDQSISKMLRKGVRDPRVYNDLAITHYGLDQFHSAWRDLMDIRSLGYEPSPDFLARVKKSLLDEGIDPEKEDIQARINNRKSLNPDDEDNMDTAGVTENTAKNDVAVPPPQGDLILDGGMGRALKDSPDGKGKMVPEKR